MIYKMSRFMSDKTSGYQVQNKENISHRNTRQEYTGNRNGTGSNKSKRSPRVYSTFYTLIQQKEIRKVAREKGIGSWNKFNRWSTKKIKYEGLYDDNKGKRIIKSVIG